MCEGGQELGLRQLLASVQEGSVEEVEDLLKKLKEQSLPSVRQQSFTAVLNTSDNTHRTPLSLSCQLKRGDVVNLLLQYGANPNSCVQPNGKTALHYACDHEEWNVGIVRQLLEAGAKPDQQMTDGQTALHIASSHDNVEVVSLLLAHYADVNIADCLCENALCKTKCASVTKLLIDAGSDVDCGCGRPILNAVSNGNTGIVHLLMKAGANLKYDPLMWIASRKNHHKIKKLLSRGGLSMKSSIVRMKSSVSKTINPKVLRLRETGEKKIKVVSAVTNGSQPTTQTSEENQLVTLVQEGSLELVEDFLKEHKDHLIDFLKPIVDTEITPLSEACELKRGDVVHLLLQYGADPNSCVQPNGKTALHYACDHKEWNAGIVRQLLEAGAKPDQQMTDGQTALHIASSHDNVEVVSLLLAHYADVSIVDSLWENALCKTRCTSVAQLLMDAGSDIDCGCGRPILNAVTNDITDLVDMLIKAGANLHYDPLMWIAKRKQLHRIQKLLAKAGVSVKSNSPRMKSSKGRKTNPSVLRMREMGVRTQVKRGIKLH